jgi:hypothetical protein
MFCSHLVLIIHFYIVEGRMSDQRIRDSSPRTQVLAGQDLDLSKNGASPAAQGCGVFMPQNAEASKWGGQKQMWQLASRWEVTTYHTNTSVKPGLLGEGACLQIFPWVSLSFPPLFFIIIIYYYNNYNLL